MGLKLPNRACLVDAEGRVLWVWEHNHPGDFDALPPIMTNPDTGESLFLSPPNAQVVDLTEVLDSRDYLEFARDCGQIRFRRTKGKQARLVIRHVIDIDGEEQEFDHPLEHKRRVRAQRRADAQLWRAGILAAPEPPATDAPSLARLAENMPEEKGNQDETNDHD